MDSSEEITLQGHIIDSWLLPKVFDLIMDVGGSFDVGEIKVGRQKTERSFARIKVIAENEAHLERILVALQPLGAESLSRSDARTEAASADGVLPDEFYSTTHMPTQIRLSGKWIDVENTEMDVVIRVEEGGAQMIPMGEVSRGDQIVVGHGAFE